MSAKETEEHKKLAVQFLQHVVSGRIEEGYSKFVDMRGRHHNVFFPAGLAELKKAMLENDKDSPNKKLTIKNVLGDGDLVAIHSHIVLNPGDEGMVVVHLFRFAGDNIVEFWDCGQEIPANCPNADGPF